MADSRSWASYPVDYRAREMEILAGWIRFGMSGSIVGVPGSGKSNLLGFLCNRPDTLQQYLPVNYPPVALVAVDLNNLPANDTGTLLRVILRSFYESRRQFEDPVNELVTNLYLENRSIRDPFLSHSALRELMLVLQEKSIGVVLVFDRFDHFVEQVSREMTASLRGLRDSFKDTVSYIIGTQQVVHYLSDPEALGELYALLDTHVCWVGALGEADARQLIENVTESGTESPSEEVITNFMHFAGGHPGLLKATCNWWLTNSEKPFSTWESHLLEEANMRYRLEKIWRSLTLAEQEILGDIMRGSSNLVNQVGAQSSPTNGSNNNGLTSQQRKAVALLANKGLVLETVDGWRIRAALLENYIAEKEGHSPGTIWIEQSTGMLYQGKTLLRGLSPLEQALLSFLIHHPYTRHTHSNLIEAVWPEDTIREGVSTEALYQVVRGLRRKIEPLPSQPCYVINWRGNPEGGYQCFPEGKPE